LPPQLLRRSAATHRHRPGAGAQAGHPDLRRTGVGTRRVGSGADPQSAQGPPEGTRPHLPVHLAQPGGGRLCRRPDRRHVRRQAGRGRAARGPVQGARSPLHQILAEGGALRRPRPPARFRRPAPHRGIGHEHLGRSVPRRRSARLPRGRDRSPGARQPERECPGAQAMRRLWLILALLTVLCTIGDARAGLIETPMFEEAVARGDLPPVAQRIPERPRVIDLAAMGKLPGRHGGRIVTIMGSQKDIRMMTVYGYARLVTFDQQMNLVPDILDSYEVEEGRIFTLPLRPGHKWSDGHPFTAEDFRFYWEDVALNEELSRGGPPIELLVDGKPPVFEVLDELTVRYSWDQPNPEFLTAIAGALPVSLYQPAHYLKQLHIRYGDPEAAERMVKAENVRGWSSLYTRKSRQYRQENVDLPSLQPWVIATTAPAEQFVFKRNPYFHRIDANGRQLPYVDEIVMAIA